MRLDRLPIGEGLIGFLLVALLVTFILAKDTIGSPASEDDGTAPTATEPGGDGDNGGEIEITMTDNKFDNESLTVAADTDLSIPLTNNGAVIHNVHVAAGGDYAVDFCTVGGEAPCSDPARLAGGATGVLDFNLPAGEYPFRCDYHPSEMTGTLTVQ